MIIIYSRPGQSDCRMLVVERKDFERLEKEEELAGQLKTTNDKLNLDRTTHIKCIKVHAQSTY